MAARWAHAPDLRALDDRTDAIVDALEVQLAMLRDLLGIVSAAAKAARPLTCRHAHQRLRGGAGAFARGSSVFDTSDNRAHRQQLRCARAHHEI